MIHMGNSRLLQSIAQLEVNASMCPISGTLEETQAKHYLQLVSSGSQSQQIAAGSGHITQQEQSKTFEMEKTETATPAGSQLREAQS